MRVRKRIVAGQWQKILLPLLALGLLASLFFVWLEALLPGMSEGEIAAKASSDSLRDIFNNPLFAPHKILQYILQKIGFDGAVAMRAVSATFATLFVASFYQVVRRWHSRRIAFFTTLLLATSSWLLTLSRSATPAIMFVGWFFVIALLLWFRHSKRVRLAPPILLVSLTLLLYVPGTIYLLGLITLGYIRKTTEFFKFMKGLPIVLGFCCALVLVIPLGIAFIRQPSLLSAWLLLPEALSFGDFVSNLQNLVTTFFYQSRSFPEFWLGRLPLLDVFTGTMMLLGIYAYRYHLRMERTPLLMLVMLLGVIVVGAAGPQLVFLLLPFVYVLVANGMAFLLEQWFFVFPKNPVPRALATSLLSGVVIVTCSYHLSRYFIAWANAPETKQIYSNKL